MLAGSFKWGGLAPPGACLGGGGGGIERSCSFTSDFSACINLNNIRLLATGLYTNEIKLKLHLDHVTTEECIYAR